MNQQINEVCDVLKSVSDVFCQVGVESFGGQTQPLRKYEDY